MKIFKKTGFNLFLIAVFTGFVLWLTLKDDFNIVMAALAQANIAWIFAVVFVVLLSQVAIGYNLMKLTRLFKPDYKLGQGVINALVASFFHGITPSASGGQFAQVYVYKKQGVCLTDSASILWMDFIVYQATMVVLVLVLLVLRFSYFYNHYSKFFGFVILGFIVNSFVIVGLWVLVRYRKIYTWITTKGIEIGAKLHLIKNREQVLSNLNVQLELFSKQTTTLRKHTKVIYAVILGNVARLLLYYSVPFFCALALNIPVNFELWIDIIALTAFVSLMNAFIPIPGASGGTEATFILMFSTIFGKVLASSLMLIWRFMTFYLVLIIGALAFVWVKAQGEKK